MPDTGTAGVVFDLGGVILDFDHMTICQRAASLTDGAATPEEVYSRVFSSGLEELYDKGLVSSEEFYRRTIDLLGIPVKKLSIEAFSAIWNDIFTLNAEVFDIVDRLKGRVPLYLLSNTNELHFEHVLREFPFIGEAFDKSFLSYRMGMRKPEPEVFERLIHETGIPARKLFYIDDSPVHIEAAVRAGIDGFVYTSAEGLSAALGERGLA